jgi:hypothetical protein
MTIRAIETMAAAAVVAPGRGDAVAVDTSACDWVPHHEHNAARW